MPFNINKPYRCRNEMRAFILRGTGERWDGMIYSYDQSLATQMTWKAGGAAGDWESPFDLVNYEPPAP